MLVCVARSARSFVHLSECESFGISILAAHQADVARRYATAGALKFADQDYFNGAASGVPLIRDAISHLECTRHQSIPGGDHAILIGQVIHSATRPGEPLVSYDRALGAFASDNPLRDTREGDTLTGAGRMPMPPSDDLSSTQREVADEIRQGPRGEITGPFVACCAVPNYYARSQAVGTHLRFTELAISPAVRELTVLAVARFWEQAFEWTHHLPLAVAAGVPEAACADLLAGERPRGLPDDLDVALRVVVELQTHHRVSDDTYRSAVGAFGEAGVVEITTTVGYYTTLAMVMNVAKAPSPSAVEFGASAAWLTHGSDPAS